jgi:anti-sigma B factor antagonist
MKPNVKIIRPNGILDSTQAHLFRDEVSEAVKTGSTVILVNLKDVTFMDSSGLAALVLALKAVRSVNGKFCVCSVNDQVRMLFELTSMTRVFEVFESPEAFEKTLSD